MPPVGFKPAISKTERPKTHALDRGATDIGLNLTAYFHLRTRLRISGDTYPTTLRLHFVVLNYTQKTATVQTLWVLIYFNDNSFHQLIIAYNDPSDHAVYGVGLRPLACWDYGFKSHRQHGCLSVSWSVVRYRSLRRSDHSSGGFLPSVVCLSDIVYSLDNERSCSARDCRAIKKRSQTGN